MAHNTTQHDTTRHDTTVELELEVDIEQQQDGELNLGGRGERPGINVVKSDVVTGGGGEADRN